MEVYCFDTFPRLTELQTLASGTADLRIIASGESGVVSTVKIFLRDRYEQSAERLFAARLCDELGMRTINVPDITQYKEVEETIEEIVKGKTRKRIVKTKVLVCKYACTDRIVLGLNT